MRAIRAIDPTEGQEAVRRRRVRVGATHVVMQGTQADLVSGFGGELVADRCARRPEHLPHDAVRHRAQMQATQIDPRLPARDTVIEPQTARRHPFDRPGAMFR